jgi:3',5'-cyclic AMP phosphodiesterase CpdA
MVCLVHFSDIHITTRPLGWRRRDWFNKRFPAWLNLRLLGRAHRFRHADLVLAALARELSQRRPDHVIFSGDATALGFEAEVARAAALLGVTGGKTLPGLAVPGNHDYCTGEAVAGGAFERYFAPWLVGERIDGVVYPFAQRVGPLWLVAVNSSRPNLWPWDASGGVDADQLERLARLLGRLERGCRRILITHYPVVRASGKLERRSHRLRNVHDLVEVAAKGGVSLWLHGHLHQAYYHAEPGLAPFPVICAGSATQNERWSYGEYHIDGSQFRALRRIFDPYQRRFRDGDSFELNLP